MKTKVAVFLLGCVLAFSSAAQAGPPVRISVGVGNRGWCAPAPRYCPTPAVYRTIPAWYGYPQPVFYNWGPSVVVSSNGSGFSNVSPFVTTSPVVAPPVVPAPALKVYPTSTFRWRN